MAHGERGIPVRMKARSSVLIDLIQTKAELGTVAAYGRNLGFDVVVREGGEAGPEGWPEALLEQREAGWAQDEIAQLVILWAISDGRTPRQVLEQVSQRLSHLKVPLDLPVRRLVLEPEPGGDDDAS